MEAEVTGIAGWRTPRVYTALREANRREAEAAEKVAE